MLSCEWISIRLHRLRVHVWWIAALTILIGTAGCVERRMVINTEPPGAVVFDETGQPIGASPKDKTFIYYGTYHFRLAKDGYETLEVDQPVVAPWYEYFGLDFISENLIPWTIRDVRRFDYVLQRPQPKAHDEVLREGTQLKAFGQTIVLRWWT